MAKKITVVSPAGVAVFPALSRPDCKFDDLGMYKADLRIPIEEAKKFMSELSGHFKGHMGKAPSKKENTMWKVEEDDDGNETGNVIFKFRVKNKAKKDGTIWDRRPRLFDAKNKPITDGTNPWGGTIMSVAAEVYGWDAAGKKGVSLQPLAVQITELVSGNSGGNGSNFGFGETEGYTSKEVDDEMPFEETDATEASASDEEDY